MVKGKVELFGVELRFSGEDFILDMDSMIISKIRITEISILTSEEPLQKSMQKRFIEVMELQAKKER